MLDPGTGRVIEQKTSCTEQKDQEVFYEGVTSDLLVSDGSGLFVRHLRLDPKTLELARMSWWGFKDPQPKGKDRGYVRQLDLPVSETRCNYLRSGQGFLDDSLYGRTQFHLDGGEACHLLCFDKQRSYGKQIGRTAGVRRANRCRTHAVPRRPRRSRVVFSGRSARCRRINVALNWFNAEPEGEGSMGFVVVGS
jgi:hypothetical protein